VTNRYDSRSAFFSAIFKCEPVVAACGLAREKPQAVLMENDWRRKLRALRGTQGIVAEKRPELPPPAEGWAGRKPGDERDPREEGGQPLVALRSRIAPPVREVGLGNLAARPVLPWRSSGPIPRATLDTDAMASQSRRIVFGFLLRTGQGNSSGWVLLYQDTAAPEKVRAPATMAPPQKIRYSGSSCRSDSCALSSTAAQEKGLAASARRLGWPMSRDAGSFRRRRCL